MFVFVQLVWLVRELVKSGIMGADGVVMTLLKQVAGQCVHVCYCVCQRGRILTVSVSPAGGDISTKNLWLAESVLDILLEQKYVLVWERLWLRLSSESSDWSPC